MISKNDLSYVSNIGYGRAAFLIVETDYDEVLVNGIIEKAMKEKQLNEKEELILDDSDIHYLYFNKNNKLIHEQSTSKNIILKYVKGINENIIIPLNFSISNFKDHSVNTFKYKVHIE